jgi:two-component system NarL family response regulator
MTDGHAQQAGTSRGSEFRIVVAAGRPSVGAFFASMSARGPNLVSTTMLDVNASAVARASGAVMAASVAMVDASFDPAEALDVCRELRSLRTDLRIGILFCCPHAAAPDSLRPFLAAGVGSFLDLQLSAEQTLAALRGIARGEAVVRLQLSEETSTTLFNGHVADEQLSPDELVLLRLVALGYTDSEIGGEMCLSHHTIKHRIERLRGRVHARNRTHLAAVAGRLEGSRVQVRRPD